MVLRLFLLTDKARRVTITTDLLHRKTMEYESDLAPKDVSDKLTINFRN